ncbi:hypothetical protein SAMN05660865_01840 [Caloramator fervidus]|uniref:Uncharacterized protein n=1 Tax=Caloramator fervidus TaxID=29344 RepID=A0A1H5XQV4_9CLOT|nr:hypothetical protein [Caloramator fervidus]SEG14052.1 hypothetical protein SAMN05660865_01840 [Caloramator fervidus]
MRAEYVILKYNKKFIFKTFEAVKYSKGAEKYIGEIKKIFKRDVKSPLEYVYYFKLNEKYCFAKAFSQKGNNSDYVVECLLFDYINFYPFNLLDCQINYSDFAYVDLKKFNFETLKHISYRKEIYGLISKLIDGEFVNIIFDDFKVLLPYLYCAFPVEFAKDIFFTTDENFPLDVNIRFVENFQVPNVYDIKNGFYVDKIYDFTNLVEIAYTLNFDYILDFHSFLQQFGIDKIDGNIDILYWIYKLISMGIEVDRENFVRVADFCVKNLSIQNIAEVFKVLEKNFEVIISKLDILDFDVTLRFLVKIFDSNNPFLISRSQELIRFLLDEMIQKDIDLKFLIDKIDYLFDVVEEKGLYFIKSNIKKERLEFINAVLNKEVSLKVYYFYLYITLKSFLWLDYTFSQALKAEGFKDLLEKVICNIIDDFDYIKNLLTFISDNPDFFANIFMICYDNVKSELQFMGLMSIFMSIIDQKDELLAFEIRRHVKNKNLEVLYQEFKLRLERAEDKVAFFNFYTQTVFEKYNDFNKEYFDKALKDYLLTLDKENIFDETVRIIKKIINEKMILSDDCLKIVINLFEQNFEFKNLNDVKDIVRWIKIIKKIRNIQTKSDIISLIDFGFFIEENKDLNLNIKDLVSNFGRINIEGEFYKNFMLWTLPNLIRLVKGVEDHKAIYYFYNPYDEMEFYKFYLELIFKLYKENYGNIYNILLTFLVYFYFYVEPKYRLYGQEEEVEKFNEFLILMFSKHKDISIEKFNEDIIKEFENNGLSIPLMWQSVYNKLLD